MKTLNTEIRIHRNGSIDIHIPNFEYSASLQLATDVSREGNECRLLITRNGKECAIDVFQRHISYAAFSARMYVTFCLNKLIVIPSREMQKLIFAIYNCKDILPYADVFIYGSDGVITQHK